MAEAESSTRSEPTEHIPRFWPHDREDRIATGRRMIGAEHDRLAGRRHLDRASDHRRREKGVRRKALDLRSDQTLSNSIRNRTHLVLTFEQSLESAAPEMIEVRPWLNQNSSDLGDRAPREALNGRRIVVRSPSFRGGLRRSDEVTASKRSPAISSDADGEESGSRPKQLVRLETVLDPEIANPALRLGDNQRLSVFERLRRSIERHPNAPDRLKSGRTSDDLETRRTSALEGAFCEVIQTWRERTRASEPASEGAEPAFILERRQRRNLEGDQSGLLRPLTQRKPDVEDAA